MVNNKLTNKAVLMKVKTSSFLGSKLDKEATREVHQEKKASDDTGKYKKDILQGEGKLAKVKKMLNEARRDTIYNYGLPWSTDNSWIVPNDLVPKAIANFNAAKSRVDEAVADFLDNIDRLKSIDRVKHGDLYNESHYPSIEKLRDSFSVELIIHPVPDVEDFRVQISEVQMNEIKKSFEAEIATVQREAMTRLWSRVGESVKHLRDGLRKFDAGEQRNFHDTIINNIVDIVEILPALNIGEDSNLDGIAEDIKRDLLVFEPDGLRKNADDRKEAASKADDILKKMDGYF